MTYRVTILILLFIGSYQAPAQSFISFVKYRSGKRITLVPGEFLKVKTEKGSISGTLFLVTDSNFIVSHDTILDTCHLSEVLWVKFRHKSYGNSFMKGSAKSIITAGPVYIIFGIANNALAGIEPIVQERNLRTAGIISLIGVTWYLAVELITNKRHQTSKWKIIPNDFSNLRKR